MGTSFSYVCLTHDPVLTSEADVHGHGNVENSSRVAELRDLWKFRTGRASSWTGPSTWTGMEDWLASHRRCRVGIVDGYGGMVELTASQPKPPAPPKDERADAIMVALEESRRTLTDAQVKMAGEIRAGGWYVLQTGRSLRPQEAMRIREKLDQLFPGATFAVLDSNMKLVTELPDLRDAIRRARSKAREYHLSSTYEPAKVGYYGAAMALELLGRELTPERDGAGAPPAAGTAAESATATPAPSLPLLCRAQHPKVPDVTCQVVPGDHRNKEHVAETPDGVYRWRP